MTERDRAIAALQGRQPDAVPHFELEMQLTEEYFGEHLTTPDEWESAPGYDGKLACLRHDASLLSRIAERFEYCIAFYSPVHRPAFDDYREGLRALCEAVDGRCLVMAHGDPTPGIPSGRDMDEVIVGMMMDPGAVVERIDHAVDRHLERARALKEDGLDGIALCSDYCFNSGPYLSPSMFSDIITPRLKRLIQGYRALGLYTIKHTDGNLMPILDDLVEAGPHALHSLDPMAGVDIAEVKRRVGDRVCLVGNVNCALMQTGTDDEVLESCRYAMTHGSAGGGYIFSTSNVIFGGMPPRRYELMWRWWKQHRRDSGGEREGR
ncbi:MAG: hypothetical protein GF331_21680 [Chitinivibrionales bacterium]|nr:hypothetical protein [Chitinivibrionales bacterium]